MHNSFLISASLYVLMAFSTSSYADVIPEVPRDYPSHNALGKCYSTQQIEQIKLQLADYNTTRVEVSSVLRIMAHKYKLTGDSLERLLGFAKSFEQMEKELPAPDPDSDEFRNFDFKLGMKFTSLAIFLNTNKETAKHFYDDRSDANSELSMYLAELDDSREIYMSSLKPVSNQPGGATDSCNKQF